VGKAGELLGMLVLRGNFGGISKNQNRITYLLIMSYKNCSVVPAPPITPPRRANFAAAELSITTIRFASTL
jgi:hypothetical protein